MRRVRASSELRYELLKSIAVKIFGSATDQFLKILQEFYFQVIPKELDDLSAMQNRNAEDMELLKTITPEVRRNCELNIGSEIWEHWEQ